MNKTLTRLPNIGIVAAFSVFVVAMIALVQTPAGAQTAPNICRAAMVLDRSGSVGSTNLETMRQQILRLFQPTGIYNDKIQLAFWSFSSGAANTNYDAPFNTFVTSKGVNTGFQTNLNKLISSGTTNYEQGLGYNQGVMNTRDGMNTIINQSNIIVFMTDGLPNTPASATNTGSGADNNNYARSVARTAVLKHKAAGKTVIGGMVGSASQGSLNYVINGSDGNGSDVFRISTNYDDLAIKLKSVIGNACDDLLPPEPVNNFTLTPIVTSTTGGAVAESGSATFSYNVNNAVTTGASDPVNWSVKQIIVDRGQPADPLYYGNETYRDNYSCAKLEALVNGHGECTDVTSGQRAFSSGNTLLDGDASAATNVVLDDRWPAGTKVCYVLAISKPTQNATPVDRYSRAACITIGKRPMVQVHGGDLRVGRHFSSDGAPVVTGGATPDPAKVVTSLTPRSDGRTYGSWAEYGVFSPGLVIGFASKSGLQGGYGSTMPNTQEFWSQLTFANTDNEYGMFTTDDRGQGTIPDVKAALLAGRSVARDLSSTDSVDFNGDSLTSGLYKKDSGSLTINTSTLAKGKMVIVYVPAGTVTIAGNIDYFEGPYADMSEIPQLVIIAKNISIKPSVVHVSAWLISDDQNGGTVTTCDDAGVLTSLICNQQLNIDGPVMARHLSLRRTAGSGQGGAAGDPAEIINLPSTAYLWSQSEGRSDVRAQTSFTVELPPYF